MKKDIDLQGNDECVDTEMRLEKGIYLSSTGVLSQGPVCDT